MIVYQDSSLSHEYSLHSRGVPLVIWHEVLEFFAQEGVIVERWELMIPMSLKQPSYYTSQEQWDPYREAWLKIPGHGPNGEELEPAKDSWISGQIPDSTPFCPGLLTPEQKATLIGSTYKVYANGRTYGDQDPEEEIVVEERNFRRLFYRRRELISEETKRRGAEKLANAIIISSATRE
jgi:hypothetical protein